MTYISKRLSSLDLFDYAVLYFLKVEKKNCFGILNIFFSVLFSYEIICILYTLLNFYILLKNITFTKKKYEK